MDIIILVLLIFVSLILMYLIFKSNSASGSIEANDLMNFSNSLNSQIQDISCLLYTSPSPRDLSTSRMPSSA